MKKKLHTMCCRKYLFLLIIATFTCTVLFGQTDYSTEMGMTPWSDWGVVNFAPPVNFFVGTWTHVYPPMGSGSKGNDYPFVFACPENKRYIWCVSGNIGYDPVAGFWRYNANTMTQTGDHVGVYLKGTEAELRDWVYVAWHFQRNGSSTTTTEFVKFGEAGTMVQVAQETLNELYTPTNLFIGGSAIDYSHAYYQYARCYAMTSIPTIDQVNAIAMRTTADPKAWGDWPLIQGDTLDVSGNGHHITINGKWRKGIIGPLLKSATDLTNGINNEGIFNIFPNPAHEKIVIDLTGEDYKTVDIVDITGRVMLSEEIKDQKVQMNTATLPRGLYVVIVRGDNKIIKSKLLIE